MEGRKSTEGEKKLKNKTGETERMEGRKKAE